VGEAALLRGGGGGGVGGGDYLWDAPRTINQTKWQKEKYDCRQTARTPHLFSSFSVFCHEVVLTAATQWTRSGEGHT
jgi:hypothetical protein